MNQDRNGQLEEMQSQPTDGPTLDDHLADALPSGVPFTYYHFSTPPTKCAALYSSPPGKHPQRTYCESHFLSVAIKPRSPAGDDGKDEAEELMALALEVLIYTTRTLTMLFVSKADSTGYISLLGLPRTAGSPLKAICSAFVSFLVRHRQRPGVRFVVSLFARAQDQYLFPASVENPDKHVLDDRGLVRWWCRVLDPLVQSYAAEGDGVAAANGEAAPRATAKAYLTVPGHDSYETRRFFPPAGKASSVPSWTAGHPLELIAPHPSAPPRCIVPHFPDDPKARFLDELDDEIPDATPSSSQAAHAHYDPPGTPSKGGRNGAWKSVKTLAEFWEMMAFRQECSSGRLVGFVWVVLTPADIDTAAPAAIEDSQPGSQLSASQHSPPPSPSRKPRKPRGPQRPPPKRKPLSGPIPPRPPKIKAAAPDADAALSAAGPSSSITHPDASSLPPPSTPYYTWPPGPSRPALLLTPRAYAAAHELLLRQNFGSRGAAAKSGRLWIGEVGVLGGRGAGEGEAGKAAWGRTVAGRKRVPGRGSVVAGGENKAPTMLVAKRKASRAAEAPLTLGEGAVAPINVLAGGLVRKKPKVEDGAGDAPVGSDAPGAVGGVNVLSAGLVRRKAKS